MSKITVEFQAFTGFGKGDNADWDFCYEVTEEEYARLRQAAKEGYDFYDAKDVADLYDKIYDAAVDEATDSFIENDPEMIEDYLDEGQTLDEWRADDVYQIEVNFPYDWMEEYEDDEE